MISIKIPAIVITVTLTALTFLTTAREWHDIEHPAPFSAPASSPDYAPLSISVSAGKSEQSVPTRQRKIAASNNCVPNAGSASGGYQGQNGGYGGSGGPALPAGWNAGMGGSTGSGGSTGLGGWGPMTGGGMKSSAAEAASSSVAGFVVLSTILLVTGVMYL